MPDRHPRLHVLAGNLPVRRELDQARAGLRMALDFHYGRTRHWRSRASTRDGVREAIARVRRAEAAIWRLAITTRHPLSSADFELAARRLNVGEAVASHYRCWRAA